MRSLYSLLYSIALLFLFPSEFFKRPKGARGRWLREKFGGMPGLHPPGGSRGPLLWVHAVSVGEAIAASSFIRAFKERHPHYEVVVSTITDTGRMVASERLAGLAGVVYMPFDLAWPINRALKALRPSLFINMETELWPNLFIALRKSGIPLAVMNGRISEKSFSRYMKIRPLMRKLLKNVSLFCMQDEEYARRITALGADPRSVVVTGNFKFDIRVKDEQLPWTTLLNGPVIVAGSTHAGEEELLVSVYQQLGERHEGLNLVIAPRHPQRFAEVEGILRSRGVPFVRRTSIEASEGGNISGKVVLLDTVGELSSVYRACDIAVIGGSFIEHGGQNPLEPAYFGKPVVCGPHMFNFPFIKEFYAEGAAIAVDTTSLDDARDRLLEALDGLLSSHETRRAMGEKARAILMGNQGAVDKAMEAIEGFIVKP